MIKCISANFIKMMFYGEVSVGVHNMVEINLEIHRWKIFRNGFTNLNQTARTGQILIRF